ncbi:hypothetical protein BD309DRAFT_59183 [Dichomitus squalens]|nr:hypothetical protein BD309DRAFT_59183 [Dichomitus squalens]
MRCTEYKSVPTQNLGVTSCRSSWPQQPPRPPGLLAALSSLLRTMATPRCLVTFQHRYLRGASTRSHTDVYAWVDLSPLYAYVLGYSDLGRPLTEAAGPVITKCDEHRFRGIE